MMSKIGALLSLGLVLALVGCGAIAEWHRTAIATTARTRVTACIDPDAGRAAALAEKTGCDLPELSLAAMQSVEKRITKAVYKVLTVESSVASRVSFGGTPPTDVKREAKRWLKLLKG